MVVKYLHTTNRGEYSLSLEFPDAKAKADWLFGVEHISADVSDTLFEVQKGWLYDYEVRLAHQDSIFYIRKFTEKWGMDKVPYEVIRATRYLEGQLQVPARDRVFRYGPKVPSVHRMLGKKKQEQSEEEAKEDSQRKKKQEQSEEAKEDSDRDEEEDYVPYIRSPPKKKQKQAEDPKEDGDGDRKDDGDRKREEEIARCLVRLTKRPMDDVKSAMKAAVRVRYGLSRPKWFNPDRPVDVYVDIMDDEEILSFIPRKIPPKEDFPDDFVGANEGKIIWRILWENCIRINVELDLFQKYSKESEDHSSRSLNILIHD